jgi:hypothetical protein
MVSFLFLLTFLFIPLPKYPSTTPPLLLLPSLPALLSDLLLLLPSPLFAPGSRELMLLEAMAAEMKRLRLSLENQDQD